MIQFAWVISALWLQEVSLPLSEYEALWRRVHPSEFQVNDEREAAIIERADVQMTIDKDRVRLKTKYRIRVVHKQKVRLSLGSGRLVSIDSHGSAIFVERSDDTNQWVVDEEAGVYDVSADMVLPLTPLTSTARASSQIEWLAPVAGAIRVQLKLPEDMEIACDKGGVMLEGDSPILIAESGEPLILHVGNRRQQEEQQPFSYRAQVTASDSVARTRRQIRTQINLIKQGGEWQPLVIQLPEGAELARIEAPDEVGHTVEESRLTVNVPVGFGRICDLGLVFRLEPTQSFLNLVPTPEGAVQTEWLVGTLIEGDGLLVLVDSGRTQIVNNTDELITRINQTFSRFHARGSQVSDFGTALEAQTSDALAEWSVEWSETAELLALRIDTAHVRVTLGSAGHALYQVWFEVFNNGAGRLDFMLPEGAQWTKVMRDQTVVQAAQLGRSISVPLRAAPETKQIVFCSAIVPLDLPNEGSFRLALPACSAPMAQVRLALISPPGFKLKASADKPNRQFAPPSHAEIMFPQGFEEVAYGWNAMASQLEPVTIDVDVKNTRDGWL